MNTESIWPARLMIMRHAQSQSNLARKNARLANELEFHLGISDAEVPLTDLGKRQANAAAGWFATLPECDCPNVVYISPYLRTQQTAQPIIDVLTERNIKPLVFFDERLREAESGLFEGVTAEGIEHLFPDEHQKRKEVGLYFYRPPGGESWDDVTVRNLDFLEEVRRHYHNGERVLLVAHSIVTVCLRKILENLTPEQTISIWDIPNCSITSYLNNHERLELCQAFVVPPGVAEVSASFTA